MRSLIVFGAMTFVFLLIGIGFYLAGSPSSPSGLGDDLRPQFTVTVEPQPTNVHVNAQLAICAPGVCSPYTPNTYGLSVTTTAFYPLNQPPGSNVTTNLVLGVPPTDEPPHLFTQKQFTQNECPTAEIPIGKYQMKMVRVEFKKNSGTCSLAIPLSSVVGWSLNGPASQSTITFLFESGLLVNQDAYFLHAVLPGFTTNAAAQSTFDRTYEVPFSDNTSDYNLQVGKSPIKASEHYWQWEDPSVSVNPDSASNSNQYLVDALPVTAVNLGGQHTAGNYLLVAGLFFGFAGGALIATVQALLDLSRT